MGSDMPAIERISGMLRLASSDDRLFPATIFYNEGWLLRLVVDWLSRTPQVEHSLRFASGARWFSEALLPSQFLARHRGDGLAEGWTHADAVIGHVTIGKNALANTQLNGSAQQFMVVEAKLFSPLSPRVTHAAYFDQAARNVACMAEVLARAGRSPQLLSSLGFFVIAPREQIARQVFSTEMSVRSIGEKVARRVSEYPSAERDSKEQWLREWFLPTLSQMKVDCLCWEDIIDSIRAKDAEFGSELSGFYAECLRFNRIQEPDLTAASGSPSNAGVESPASSLR
jgi:hypothetical protein